MARTNKYHCETKNKYKPPTFFATRRCGKLVLCDLVMHCTMFLYFFLAVLNTSPIVEAKVTITGSGGYSSRRIQLDLSDGGYKGIVVKIDKEVPEKHCPKILSNIKVREIKTIS